MGSKDRNFLHLDRSLGSVDKKSRHVADNQPVSFGRSNRGIALILIAIVVAIGIYIWASEWAHREVRDGFKLGSFPIFAVVMMLASLLVMALDSKRRSTTDAVRGLKLVEVALVLVLLAGLGGLFLLIPVLGFAVVIFLIVFFGSLLLGYRPIWIALVTAFVTAAALHGLTIVLNVQFPPGLLAYLGG